MSEAKISGTEIEGAVQDVAGQVKDAIGGITGDAETQAEGKADETVGTIKREFGGVADDVIGGTQDTLETLTDLVRDNPLPALGIAAAFGFLVGAILIPSRK